MHLPSMRTDLERHFVVCQRCVRRAMSDLQAAGKREHQRIDSIPVNQDREAVAAAVRGASKQAPEGRAPNFNNMSDNEFRDEVKKTYGFTPGI